MIQARDLKYLIAYLAPISAGLGLYLGGIWSLGSFYLAFLIIPLAELITPNNGSNLTPEIEHTKSTNKFFDLLLYLNLPLVYLLLTYYFVRIYQGGLTTWEEAGMTINIGFILGSFGINVAHELGHRRNKFEQWMSKALLLPNLYMHFFIEHNRGHHLQVGTPEDPSTARFGETIYHFWWRSTSRGYLNAWKLNQKEMDQKNIKFWNYQNQMLRFTLIQSIYLLAIFSLFGLKIMLLAITIGFIGFTLLEFVNYIEHYGLLRKTLSNGRYEHVDLHHSWNSNHSLGRIFLYELTRHADHHAKSYRKYQILEHFDQSPQLPTGYPGSIIVSLIPPLWFKIMNPLVRSYQKSIVN